jgi:hypothetical protein
VSQVSVATDPQLGVPAFPYVIPLTAGCVIVHWPFDTGAGAEQVFKLHVSADVEGRNTRSLTSTADALQEYVLSPLAV